MQEQQLEQIERPKVKWNKPTIDLLKELLESGKSTRFIASELNTTPNNIRQQMFKLGLKANLKTPREAQKPSISKRIMELTGLTIKDSQNRKGFADEQLLSFRNGLEGFKRFCKDVLGIDLQEHQIDIVDKMINNRHSVFLIGRRGGKTFTCSLYALWRTIITPSINVCLISPSFESSLIIFKQLMVFLARSEELRWGVRVDKVDELEFDNGSNIKSLSSKSLALRGRENDICLIDEVAIIENPEELIASISPSLASRKGSQMIMISTPRDKHGLLWDSWSNDIYAKSIYPSTANKYLDLEWLELEKKKLPPEIYRMEYECEWADSINMFFPSDLINRCTEEYELGGVTEGEYYYAGIDIGRISDFSTMVILANNRLENVWKVRQIFVFERVPFEAQVERFVQILDKYNVHKLEIEYNGMSAPVVEMLENRWDKHKIKRFIPTIASKEKIYFKLKADMERGKLHIPKHDRLLDELRNFEFVYTPQGVKLHHKQGHHDDIIDSLAQAWDVANIETYKPVILARGFYG